MPTEVCLIPISPIRNSILNQVCQIVAETPNAISNLRWQILNPSTLGYFPKAQWSNWQKDSKYFPYPILEWGEKILQNTTPINAIKLFTTDVVLFSSDPKKRYEIYVDSRDSPNTALLSIAILDPYYWSEVGFEPRTKRIARRLLTICLRIVSLKLGMVNCQDPSCPLFRDLSSISAIDRMDGFCHNHERLLEIRLAGPLSSGDHSDTHVMDNGLNDGEREATISNTTKDGKPLKIFLCHSSGDKPVVRELYQRLRKDGFDPWLDEENLLPGQEWQKEIPKAVRESNIVLVCLSNRSVNKAGYLQKEIKYILDVADEQPEGVIFLIPVKLEECEVPERLRKWQWVNFFEENGYERLSSALKAHAQPMGLDR